MLTRQWYIEIYSKRWSKLCYCWKIYQNFYPKCRSINKINKIVISKKGYIDKIDNIANKSNNTYNRTIKIKPIVVDSQTYIDFDLENEEKCKVGNHVKISKYKNYEPNWSDEAFVIKKLKILYHGHVNRRS